MEGKPSTLEACFKGLRGLEGLELGECIYRPGGQRLRRMHMFVISRPNNRIQLGQCFFGTSEKDREDGIIDFARNLILKAFNTRFGFSGVDVLPMRGRTWTTTEDTTAS